MKKPMLAANERIDLDNIRYPKLASGKIDGVRAICQGGKVLSRSLKESINPWVRRILGHSMFEGLDGELTVAGQGWNDFNTNQSRFMEQSDSKFSFIFHVFDDINLANEPAEDRKTALLDRVLNIPSDPAFAVVAPFLELRVVQQHYVTMPEEVASLYGSYRAEGYEGLILCDPNASYKHGRSTLKQEIMLKVKPNSDSEAEIIGLEEAMHNLDAGNSKRQENLVPAGRTGKMLCQWDDKVIRIGTGFDHTLATDMHNNPENYIGRLAKFKYMELTPDGQPRHAVFVGFRDRGDM